MSKHFYFTNFALFLIISFCCSQVFSLPNKRLFLSFNEFAGKIERIVALDENELFLLEQAGEISNLKTKILKSTNGGKSWEENFVVENQNFHSLYFFDKKIGFTSAKSDKTVFLYKTENAGNSWQIINRSIPDFINEIQFIDVNTGFILCDNGSLLKTFDGGKNWEEVRPSVNEIKSIYFTDKLIGWVITQNGELFRTRNGGKTWKNETIKISADLAKWKPNDISLIKIKFIDSKEGYLGVRFKTTKAEKKSNLSLT